MVAFESYAHKSRFGGCKEVLNEKEKCTNNLFSYHSESDFLPALFIETLYLRKFSS